MSEPQLRAPMLEENARLRAQAEALAAALETALYYAEMYAVWPFDRGKVADARAALRAYREPVPHQVNSARGNSGKQERERTHCPQGHPYDEENTRWDRRGELARGRQGGLV